MTPRPLSQIPNGEILAALQAAEGVTYRAAEALGVDVSNLTKRIRYTPMLAAERKYLQSIYGRSTRGRKPSTEMVVGPDQCPRCGLKYVHGAQIVVDSRPMCCWCAVEQRAAAARHTWQAGPNEAQRECIRDEGLTAAMTIQLL
jgi:hypothetical protein